jgi:hypothetical protein
MRSKKARWWDEDGEDKSGSWVGREEWGVRLWVVEGNEDTSI